MSGRQNFNATFTCNKVDSANIGFEFYGVPANPTTWRNNFMGYNRHGLYYTAGYIGQQGGPTQPSDNIWDSCVNLPLGYYHTWNQGTSPDSLSKLYVRANASLEVFDPWANGSSGGPVTRYRGGYGSMCGTWFDLTTLIQVVSPPSYVACNPTYTTFPTGSLFRPLVGGGDTVTTGNGDEGRSTAGSVNTRAGRRWIAQMSAWQAMLADSTMADSAADLQEFKTLAANSRFVWLTSIADNIANGNYDAATSAMAEGIHAHTNVTVDDATGVAMADGTGADYVVQNYLDIYRLGIKYALGELTDGDKAEVAELANLCPGIDGTIIYTARGLYSNVFGNLLALDDNCVTGDTSYSRSSQQPIQPVIRNVNELAKNAQGYSLQPNPNNGNLTITQKNADNTPVKVQVWNATGAVVYSKNAQFEIGKMQVHIPNSLPGLYLLQISDNFGNTFTRKFIIQ
jgi:hypothetical protein